MGEHATPDRWAVVGANASWIVIPLLILWRMWNTEHPFTRPIGGQPQGV
jgi:hypothetical protein